MILIIACVIILIVGLVINDSLQKNESYNKHDANQHVAHYVKHYSDGKIRYDEIHEHDFSIRTNAPKYFDNYYDALLNTDEWYRYKKTILKRDNYTCQCCGATNKSLQVHHLYYLKYPDERRLYPWEYDESIVVSLCDNCHKKEHDKWKPKTYYVKFHENKLNTLYKN